MNGKNRRQQLQRLQASGGAFDTFFSLSFLVFDQRNVFRGRGPQLADGCERGHHGVDDGCNLQHGGEMGTACAVVVVVVVEEEEEEEEEAEERPCSGFGSSSSILPSRLT
jgi:hypothetical protein